MEKTLSTGDSILYVINPGAGSGIPQGFEKLLKKHSEEAGIQSRVLTLSSESGKKQVEESIKKINPDVVVACGGDGTVNLVAEVLLDLPLKMGIIPLGSSNGLAFELNIPTDPERALNLILRGKSRMLDALRINEDHLCLHISDVGMNARVVKYFQKDNLRGLLGYAKHYIRVLGQINKFKCTVKGHKQEAVSKVLMVVIANASYYGTGAVINPEGRLDDGRFEIILVRFSLTKFILRLLIHWFTRNVEEQESFRIIPASKEEIIIDPPQDMQVDGEPIGKVDRVTIEVLHKKIEVFYSEDKNPQGIL